MKPEELYQELKNAAEKVGVAVTEKSFRNIAAGIHFQSGLCTVHGAQRFIMDRNISIHDKNRLLADCLAKYPLDEVFLVPAVRDFLDKNGKRRGGLPEK